MSRGFVILIARPVAHAAELTEKRLARQSLVSQKVQGRVRMIGKWPFSSGIGDGEFRGFEALTLSCQTVHHAVKDSGCQ